MILEITNELRANLLANGCPIPVFGRDKRTPAGWTPDRIVIEHDLDGGDTFGPPRSQRENPKHSFARGIGAKATIYAKAAGSGAIEAEHRALAEQILHQVLYAMRLVGANRRNQFTPKSGRFVVPKDVEQSDVHAGAAYELKFSFEQAVHNRTWAGNAKPEGTLVRVSMTGSPGLTFADNGATGDTITRDSGSWLDDGFGVGMQISVRGSTANNVSGATLAAVTATVLTLDTTALVAEGPTPGCKVVAGGFKNTAYVSLDEGTDALPVPPGAEIVWQE